MVSYHLDDNTGHIAACANLAKCKLNKTPDEHYATVESARDGRNWTFKVRPPRLASNKAGYSDLKNIFRRVATDKKFSSSDELGVAWRAALKHWDGLCYLCERPLFNKQTGLEVSNLPNDKGTADHIFTPAQGGSTTAGNIAPAHAKCNRDRGSTPIEEVFADRPESLNRVRNFQKKFKYKPASADEMAKFNEELEIVWAGLYAQLERITQS